MKTLVIWSSAKLSKGNR